MAHTGAHATSTPSQRALRVGRAVRLSRRPPASAWPAVEIVITSATARVSIIVDATAHIDVAEVYAHLLAEHRRLTHG